MIGSIISGTLRNEDLLAAFADELTARDLETRYCLLVANARTIDPDSDAAPELVNDLIDALNDFAPDYCYFGAHCGDGSDFGYWLCEDWQQIARDDGVVFLDAGAANPANGSNVAFITDHGNVSYGYIADGEFIEVWSVV